MRLYSNGTDASAATRGAWFRSVLLIVGSGLAIVAAVAAHRSPAQGYELSVYDATPVAFWLGVGGALAIALGVALFAYDGRQRVEALVLAGVTFALVASLPLTRGYAFYGRGDALSHLGWVRDVAAGRLGLVDLLYPGLHGLTLQVAALTGLAPERSMMLVVFAFVVLFSVSMTLAVRTVTRDRRATVVAAFSSFMLLPLNHVSAHLTGHPSTMAIMFLPVVLVVLVLYLGAAPGPRPSALGGLLALSSLAMVLLHPQQAANLLAVFAIVVAAQLYRRTGVTRSVVGQTAFLGVVLVGWVANRPRVTGAVDGLVTLVLSGGGPSVVAQRGGSLTAIGSSLVELFLKLFFVNTVYLALAGIIMLASLQYRERNPIVTYLSLGTLAAGGIFAVYFAAQVQTMYFRHFGFVMVLVTLFGTIGFVGLTRGSFDLIDTSNVFQIGTSTDGGTEMGSSTRSHVPLGAATIVLGVLLVLSMLVLYPSPYIFQPNQQVTEAQLDGYDSVFAHENADHRMFGIREGPDRFRDALTGTGELDSSTYRDRTGLTSDQLAAGLPASIDGTAYVVVSDADRTREVGVYRELRYTSDQLSTIGLSPGVDRVQSNGAVELYVVSG